MPTVKFYKEVWDAYDREGNKLGFDIYRDEPVPENVYHIVVEIYTVTRDNRVLITRRHPNKSYPLKWENTGGSILKGETPVLGAIRELYEETGIKITENQIKLAYSEVKHPPIYNCFVALVDNDVEVKLQEGETVEYKFIPYDEFMKFICTDEFVDKIRDSILRHKDEISVTLEKLKSELNG